MEKKLISLAIPMLAALLVAGSAVAADKPGAPAGFDSTPSQSPPVDCKEKPDDEKCKDKK